MFDGYPNVQLGDELMKIRYQKLNIMCGVEHTIYLFFNDFTKVTIINQMIKPHKLIYNLLLNSRVYHKP